MPEGIVYIVVGLGRVGLGVRVWGTVRKIWKIPHPRYEACREHISPHGHLRKGTLHESISQPGRPHNRNSGGACADDEGIFQAFFFSFPRRTRTTTRVREGAVTNLKAYTVNRDRPLADMSSPPPTPLSLICTLDTLQLKIRFLHLR